MNVYMMCCNPVIAAGGDRCQSGRPRLPSMWQHSAGLHMAGIGADPESVDFCPLLLLFLRCYIRSYF
jgi:hypothetical protein